VPVPASHAATPIDVLLAEIRAVRETQKEILELLRSRPTPAAEPAYSGGFEGFTAGDEREGDEPAAAPRPDTPPVRSRRRKSVLLIDDDPQTCRAAAAALEAAQVPVRIASDGQAGIAAIAEEKPDVIALELDMGGAMGGKDVINMIKATMEWVDVPLVLYTRAAIASQKDARTIHGADDYVAKGPDSAALLVTRVISFFRRA
jgi:CheY-like chemotaxis protein